MAHLTHEEMLGYRRGAMAAGSLIRADRHLAVCAACSRQMREWTASPKLPEAAAAIEEPLHIEYVQMTAYLDSKLEDTPRGQVDLHLSVCTQCARELDDLRTFDEQLIAELAPAQPTVPTMGKARAVRSLYLAWTEFWRTPQRLGLAAAGLALLLVSFAMLLRKDDPIAGLAARPGLSAHVWHLSTAHPQFFYGAALIGLAGMAMLVYAAMFRR